MSYSDKLKDHRWQKKRLRIFDRDHWRCRLCHSFKFTLAVHHIAYQGEPWDADDSFLVTVCEHCHEIVQHCKNEEQRKSFGIILMATNLLGTMLANNYDFSDRQAQEIQSPNPDKSLPHIGHYATGPYRESCRLDAMLPPPWTDREVSG